MFVFMYFPVLFIIYNEQLKSEMYFRITNVLFHLIRWVIIFNLNIYSD